MTEPRGAALRGIRGAVLLLGALALSACESAYYGAMEQFGVHAVTDDYAALTGCAAHLARL